MDIGDYLYLIIFLGAALFSYVSKAMEAKKGTENQIPTKNSPQRPKPEVVVPTRTKRTTLKRPQEGASQQPVLSPLMQERMNTLEQNGMLNSLETLEPMTAPSFAPIGDEASQESESSPLTIDLSDRYELKRAVIYSEIFHRKY